MAPTGGTKQPTARLAPWSREDAALDPRIRRRLFTSGRAMVILSSVPTKFSEDHVHAVDQVIAVLSGRVELRVEEATRTLATGESVLVAAGVPHSVRSVGPREAETLNVFSPEGS